MLTSRTSNFYETMTNESVYNFVVSTYCQSPEKYLRYRLIGKEHTENALISLMKKVLPTISNEHLEILDIGCGANGSLGKIKFSCYTGVDISNSLLEKHPYRNKKNTTFMVCDLNNFDPSGFRYNFVLGSLVLNYIEKPDVLIKRLRRPNCGFYFSVPNPEYDRNFGEIKNGNIVSIYINKMHFIYYLHETQDIINAIKPSCDLNVTHVKTRNRKNPAMYICLYGRW